MLERRHSDERTFKIVILDDEEKSSELLKLFFDDFFSREEIKIKKEYILLKNADEGRKYFIYEKKDADLVILDFYMTNGKKHKEHLNGDAFLKSMNKAKINLPVVAITTERSKKESILNKLGILIYLNKADFFSKKEYGKKDIFENIIKSRIETFLMKIKFLDKEAENIRNTDKSIAIQDALERNLLYSETDRNGFITYVNDNFCKISRFRKNELIGQKHKILRSQNTSDTSIKEMMIKINAGLTWSNPIENKKKNGESYWVHSTITPIISSKNGEITGFINIARDISQLYLAANIDNLTGCYNREYFYTTYKTDTFNKSLILIDIDFFKKVNDNYGHSVGDDILKGVSEIIRKSVRSDDAVVRWGGEEFIILLENTKIKNAENIAEKIRKNVEIAIINNINVTISLGVTEIKAMNKNSDKTENLLDFIKRSDDALYQSKENGRNRVTCL